MSTTHKKEKSILIIANTLFYPARRNGVSIRYFTLIRELRTRGYAIDIIVINKYQENYNESEIKELSRFCNNVDIIKIAAHSSGFFKKSLRRVINILHLLIPFGMPYELLDNNYKYSLTSINNLIKNSNRYDFGIGVGVGGCNADMLLSLDRNVRPNHIICDFIDSAYLLRKRARKNILETLNPINVLEDIKTKWWESLLCKRCDCIYISEKDAETDINKKATVIPNCITEDGHDESSPANLLSPNIGFLGNMAYPPNIKACTYLVNNLFPLLKKRFPDITLYIIGRYPSKTLIDLCANDQQIHLTGEVDNIWNYVRSIDVFVFPIQSGAGLQNKILEAMYAGKPVITSSIGNEGIDATHGEHLYIANNANEYIHYIEKALSDSNSMSKHAREHIDENFSTASFIKKYGKVLHII